MDPRDFLELAQRLVIGTPKPSNLRTATSRAYYAAHHVGAEILTGMDFRINRGPGGHADVWGKLQNCGNQDVQVAGSQLADLHSARIQADYRLENPNSENQTAVRGHIALAQKIVQTINRECFGPTRQPIIDAIKAYIKILQGR
jgi:hypothetical protein